VETVEKRLLLLTGEPGVGKTTVLLKTVEALRAKDYRVGGMISREVRSCGGRVGFEILDLNDGKTGWLANVNQKTGPQVGKYRVNLENLNDLGATSILKAADGSDVTAIDEIGPMELYSDKFIDAVRRAIESQKLVISVIHKRAKHTLIDEIRYRTDVEIYTVTRENRENLHKFVVQRATEFLNRKNENKVL
jgi:nucleoside-triphosphatase